jgi:hypothetical protein
MLRHLLLAASSTALLLALTACGSVTALDDVPCPAVEDTTTIVYPIDTGAVDFAIRGSCIDAAPTIDATDRVDCFVIYARAAKVATSCDSDLRLTAVSADHQGALERLMASDDAKSSGWNTFCEIPQLDPASAAAENCRTEDFPGDHNADGTRNNGFCYIDATTVPPTGNPEIAGYCSESGPPRSLRFLDGNVMAANPDSQSLTIVCAHEVCPAP